MNAERMLDGPETPLNSSPSTSTPTGCVPNVEATKKITKEWHNGCTQDLRNHIVYKIVRAIFPIPSEEAMKDRRMHNLVSYARNIEGNFYENVNSMEEYYHYVAEKIYRIKAELKSKRKARRELKKLPSFGVTTGAGIGTQRSILVEERCHLKKTKVLTVPVGEQNRTTFPASRKSSSGYQLKKSYDNTLSESLVISFGVKMKSVGALVYKKELGTVFRVGSHYVMTACHVVQHIIGKNDVTALQKRSVFVNFNESLVEQGGLIYHLTNFVLWDTELDFAVLEISNPDDLLPPGLQLCSDENEYIRLEEVSFIGYGHPNKSGKHLDPRCSILPPHSDKISRARKWLDDNSSTFKSIFKRTAKHSSIVELVDTAYEGLNHPDKLIFDCHMHQGGSGSPALTNDDADSIRVAGILTHELPEFYYHLNNTKQRMIKDEYRFEMGSKMSSILKCIYETDKKLASNICSKPNVEIVNNTRARPHEAIMTPTGPVNPHASPSNVNYH